MDFDCHEKELFYGWNRNSAGCGVSKRNNFAGCKKDAQRHLNSQDGYLENPGG
jgi:hypothetical protein